MTHYLDIEALWPGQKFGTKFLKMTIFKVRNQGENKLIPYYTVDYFVYL